MKTYLCTEKCFFRNRLHHEGVYYQYGDGVKVTGKSGRSYFTEVNIPGVEVLDGGLGKGTINPAPDKRQPKIINTEEVKEQIRPQRSRVKTGILAGGTPGQNPEPAEKAPEKKAPAEKASAKKKG